MNQEMAALCRRVLKTAKQNGAEECKVGLAKAKQFDISYREQKPETVKQALTRRLALEIYIDRRYSFQTTSDLRLKTLERFVAQAIANTKLLAQDPYRGLPDPSYYRERPAIDLKIADPDYSRLTPEKRHSLAKTMEAACRSQAGAKAVTITADWRDRFYEALDMTSNGLEGFEAGTIYSATAFLSVQDEGLRRPQRYYYNMVRMLNALEPAEEIGRQAARRAVNALGAKKIKTETLPVIVENLQAAQVLQGLLAALQAYNIQQKQSFLADKKEQKIGSDLLTLIDDPLLVSGLGSRLFDNDGLVSKKRTMVQAGVLKHFYVDWYYGRKLDWEPTSVNPSNLILPPGKRSPEQIMRDLGRGVFITGFIGGNSNATTGDFSIGIEGFLFENGGPAQPIAEMNIADNHLAFWNKLIEAGNDPWPHQSWRIPSLVFRDVVVSGV